MTRRVLALGAVILVALIVQTTLLGHVRILGARPDVTLLAVVAVAMASGSVSGAAFGFAAGLATDLLLDLPVGVSALVYTAIGYAIGSARVYMVSRSPLVPAALAAAASLAAVWASGSVLRLLDLSGFSWGFLARSAVAVAVFNLLVTPVVYPLVHTLAEHVRAERVAHW
jgi:rod shape-determining protein MreD